MAKKRRYRRWHLLLDFVGIASVVSCILYVVYGHHAVDQEVANIWSGLSTELLGAWVTARAIEVWLRKDEEFDSVRIRVLRNLRFFVAHATRCVEYAYRPDILQFFREQKWSVRFFTEHRSAFDQSEVEDILAAHAQLTELSNVLSRIMELRSTPDPDEAALRECKQRGTLMLRELEDAVLAVEDNILEETSEHR